MYFHYKVYKRVQKKKKEKAAKLKKKKADAAKKKKKGFRPAGGSVYTKTTPAPTPAAPKPMQKAVSTAATAEKPKKTENTSDGESINLSVTLQPNQSMPLSETLDSGLERADTDLDGISRQDSVTGEPGETININTNADLGSIVEQPGEGEEGKEGDTVDGDGNPIEKPTIEILGATGTSEMGEGLKAAAVGSGEQSPVQIEKV